MIILPYPQKPAELLFFQTGKARKLLAFSLTVLCCFLAAFQPVSAFSATSREKYAVGRKYMQEGKWQNALEIIKPLVNDYPLLTDYVLRDMAVCYEKSGDEKEAVNTLRKLISGYQGSPLYLKAYDKLLEIGNNGDIASNLVDCDLYLKEFPRDSKTLWQKSCLLAKSGRTTEARALQREIFLTGSPYTVKSFEALKDADCEPSYKEIKKALACLLEKGHYEQAMRLLEGVDLEDEEGKNLLARAYFRLRLYRRVIKLLPDVTSPDGKYLLAMSVLRAQGKESFYKLFDEFVRQNPRELFQLHLTAIDLKQREGNFRDAATLLQTMKNLYPDQREKIFWTEAWLAIRQKRFPEADKILTKLVADQTKTQGKYLFWLGKVKIYQGKKGDEDFSRIHDRNSYYWFKAGLEMPLTPAERSGELAKAKPSPIIPASNRYLLRIAELESLEMRAEAKIEARWLLGNVKYQDVPVLAGLLVAIGDYPGLIKLGRRHNDLHLIYPFAFRELVIKCAQEQNFDPLLITAIMREESHFSTDAVSGAGALGLMQLMPSNVRKAGHISNDKELFEAQKNIRLGTAHLSRLLSQFKELPYAIAAYNAGTTNVKKWLAADYHDVDEFAEDIPFGETKDYVLRVMTTYYIMRALYGNERATENYLEKPSG